MEKTIEQFTVIALEYENIEKLAWRINYNSLIVYIR